MTSADEAVERVRAYIAGLEGHHGRMTVDVNAGRSFTLDDLRALLSALELGSVGPSALPVVTADEPATPSDLDALGRAMLNLNADRIAWRKGNPRPALLTLRDMDAIWAALSPTTLGEE